jgi:hypothetical protein
MTEAAFDRWQKASSVALADGKAASDLGSSFSATSRTFRLFLQSAMLGLGPWIVLQGELAAGAMIASFILMGRALQPIEQAVVQWAVLTRARRGACGPARPPNLPRPHHAGTLSVLSADYLTDQRTGQTYYCAEITLPPEQANRAGDALLLPGMPVDVFIWTVSRTPMTYLLKPYTDYFQKAFRES